MKIYFTFKEGTHIGATYKRLREIFKTTQIEKAENGVNEVVVEAFDFEKHKQNFPYSLAIKLTRVRSNTPSFLEQLAMGWKQFDNQNCQEIIKQISKA